MRTLPLLVTTVLSTYAADAYALSCAACPDVQAPARFTALPSNFELRVRAEAAQSVLPTVQGPGDPQLDCAPIDDIGSNLLSCRVTSPLTPGVTYTIDDGSGWLPETNLTVTADEDHDAPAAPTIVSITRRDRKEEPAIAAGPQVGIDIAITADEPTETMSIEVMIIPTDTQAAQTIAATGYTDEGVLRAFVGQTFCQCSGLLTGGTFGSEVEVRVRLVDAAGNRSAWTQPVVPDPDPEASGCTCTALPSQLPWAAFAGLLFAAYAIVRSRR